MPWDSGRLIAFPSFRVYDARCDFDASGLYDPWAPTAINSGAYSLATPTANHPGIIQFTSHASNANSGYGVYIGTKPMVLAGGEEFNAIFNMDTATGLLGRIGFADTFASTVATNPLDGVYLDTAGGTLTGKTVKTGGAVSTTSTNYALVAGTWYTGTVRLNANATTAIFELRSDAGALLWSSSLSTNIPTLPLNHGITGAIALPGGATNTLKVDAIHCQITRTLVRGY